MHNIPKTRELAKCPIVKAEHTTNIERWLDGGSATKQFAEAAAVAERDEIDRVVTLLLKHGPRR